VRPEHHAGELAGKVVMVTGGVGFIGSALSTTLARLGAEVHTVSRRVAEALPSGRHWQVDLTDEEAVTELVDQTRPDYVFHLASHVMGAPDLHHVLPAFHGNLRTTVNLLTALAESGCTRMITTGSLVEPEGGSRGIPNSPYAAAKWASSDYARMFHALYDFPVSIARVFMVYGPGQQDMTKLVPYVISCVLRGESPKVTSGTHRIDWIYVDDVVAGFLQLALAPDAEGASVDFGSGAPVTIRELVDELCAQMGGAVEPVYGALPDRPLEPIRVADVAGSAEQIGWSPTIDLVEGLSRTIAWYRARLPLGATP
jgi:UDP-glucose 4-epimerase